MWKCWRPRLPLSKFQSSDSLVLPDDAGARVGGCLGLAKPLRIAAMAHLGPNRTFACGSRSVPTDVGRTITLGALD